ncbi:MAG: class I SAM-dependent methyltransferase [Pseudomonadota bacterium]
MDPVQAQYEAYPYPARDPADERKRLIVGSPSHPVEVDHVLFSGRRDWAAGTRVLVAGGGTGDGLIQIAAVLAAAGRPTEITYLDPSEAARGIAEARAGIRGLDTIRFLTASLFDAPDLGPFDYIDCCGVLHHLDDPTAGFAALGAALAPGGGIGFMVYAPLGRSGVYPLQAAFNTAFGHLPPTEKLAAARAVFDRLPDGHPFRTNPHLGDHADSAAGFYDLLLHSRDRAFTVAELLHTLDVAGLDLAGFAQPGLYDPARFLAGQGADLTPPQRMALAEQLSGGLKTHVGYAVPKGAVPAPPTGRGADIPHLRGPRPAALAQHVAKTGRAAVTLAGERIAVEIPKAAAPLIAGIDGRRDVAALIARAAPDPVAGGTLWAAVDAALRPWGLLHYARLHR